MNQGEQEKVEYFKRIIKRTYKRYTGERTDEKATLSDVAKLFNVPIDEARIGDYTIKRIDFKTPSIEIADEGMGISYSSFFTRDADLLNHYGPILNKVVSVSSIRKVESLYYIGSDVPIMTKMTFVKDNYELVFEHEIANNIGCVRDGEMMCVSLLTPVVLEEGVSLEQLLLSRVYEAGYTNRQSGDIFEHKFTYGPNHFIKFKNTLDKFAHIKNNNVIYGVNELNQDGLCTSLSGICFESTKLPVNDYLPFNINARNYSLLCDESTKSAIVFKFWTEDNIHHLLQVYKSDESITILYESYHSKNDKIETIALEKDSLPKLTDGNISSEEIESVLEFLKKRFGDSVVYDVILGELGAFRTRIDIKNGVIQEELDPLSPKLLIDKSFDEICDLVSADIDDYFEEILKQFYEATHVAETLEKDKPYTIKPVDSDDK